MLKIIGLSLFLFSLTLFPSQADEDMDIYNKALKRMQAVSSKDWSYLQTTTENDKVTIERHEDDKGNKHQWVLLSINSKKPSKRQLKKYQKKIKNKEDNSQFLTDFAKSGSIKFIQATDIHNIYHFQPLMDEDGKAMEPYIFGEIIVVRKNPRFEKIHIFNKGEFSAYGAKIKHFEQQMNYAVTDPEHPDTSPVFLQSIHGEIKGKAAIFFNLNQVTDIKFSNYTKTSP